MNTLEENMPSAEEKENQQEEIEKEEAEHLAGEDDDAGDEQQQEQEEEEEEEEEEKGGRDEQEDKVIPQAAEKIAKKVPWPIKPKEKKQDEGLNLNNEVVRMRKEVKRLRALIIRKLTRQIGALKKKKGTEMEVERNQRRAGRLLEEMHAMKALSPDLVTKTALQKNIHFEQVCKNPKSTISDRATARIATHPQFKKKIEKIKAAVKAFKEERMKGGKQGGREKVQNKGGKVTPQSPDREGTREKEEGDATVEQKEILDKEEGDDLLKDTKDVTVAEPEKETVKSTPSNGQSKEMPEAKNVRSSSIKGSEVKDVVKNKPQAKHAEKKPEPKSAPEVLQKKKREEEESDLESEGEEKEYFDDSTEERFHKQSSQSEESDDDNGFFVGKVSKFTKKKKKKSVEGDVSGKGCEGTSSDPLQGELDELESRLRSKATSFQSVFCSSLSSSKPGRGRGRGRGGDGFRGQGRPKSGGVLDRDFSKQPRFQKQERGGERNHPESFPSIGRGRGRGRGDGMRQSDRRGGRGGGGAGAAFTQQAPEQALHPSWEASKKRKEQQGQILAFQGKKIKFNDDD